MSQLTPEQQAKIDSLRVELRSLHRQAEHTRVALNDAVEATRPDFPKFVEHSVVYELSYTEFLHDTPVDCWKARYRPVVHSHHPMLTLTLSEAKLLELSTPEAADDN